MIIIKRLIAVKCLTNIILFSLTLCWTLLGQLLNIYYKWLADSKI